MIFPSIFAQLNAAGRQSAITEILNLADTVRFPTKFAREALSQYKFHVTNNISYTRDNPKEIRMQRGEFDNLVEFSSGKKKLNSNIVTAISDFYHEATHAWLSIQLKKGGLSRIIVESLVNASKKYYAKHGKLENGKKIRSLDRVVTEVFAGYIQHRTFAWWYAMMWLTNTRDTIRDVLKDLTNRDQVSDEMKDIYLNIVNNENKVIEMLKSNYEYTANQKSHGYDNINGKHVNLTTSTFQGIKDYCDLFLMNLAVPDSFPAYPHQLLAGEIRSIGQDIKAVL